ncbi:hypothetical protein AURDEDRAFT_174466 [Auricularia subglabra TFB-10046 SS5]|uniref:Uncharacterized protein n=1 Tax=Auricularia subglabra (strain TFB-10046 / SS5) TaxID=717982 RepID=J0WT88_AURST|nr:hypothetical protein AURDEDRAFT_174466 [Auricularia subglabra TFB-10046 SS5]
MADNSTAPESYLPVGETAADLYVERTNFGGTILGAYLYGIHFTLAVIALHYFFSGKSLRKVEWPMVAYTVLLFTGSTLYMVATSKWAENMWIENRNYPGGPLGYYLNEFNTPMIILGNAAYIFNNFLADGLLVYRTWIVYNRNWLIIAFPVIVFLGSTIMSIMATYQLAQPGAKFFSHIGLVMSLPYFSLSIALNLILTIMIATKLLLSRRRLMAILGPEHAKIYTGIVAMLVESAAVYSVFSILFIATFSINNSLFNACLPIQAQIMCIAPLLIMIRVARGRAYSREAATSNNSKHSVSFNPNSSNGRRETYNMSTLNDGGVNMSTTKIVSEV